MLHPLWHRRRFDFYLFSGICQTSEDLYARMVFWMWLSALLRPHRSVHVLSFRLYPNFIQLSNSNKNSFCSNYTQKYGKVHIFWEGHKILRNLHRRFDRYYIGIYGQNFAKLCGVQDTWTLPPNLKLAKNDFCKSCLSI